MQKYQLIADIAAADAANADLSAMLSELCATDFQTAFEVWEFVLAKHQRLLDNATICENTETKIFGLFTRVSETKTRQLLCESMPLIRLIYGCCATAGTYHNLNFLVNHVLGNKLDIAGECFLKLRSNPNIKYAEVMRKIIDDIFAANCARNSVKVPIFNRKQKALMLEYVEKIKGPNKALLVQRIKEL
jgi:hypothetical protein